jgi:nucleoside-diphosphate-sugar epimerase
MRVLVTGHRGYIGSVLVRELASAGHGIVGLDTGYFDDCRLVPDLVSVPSRRTDLRDLEPADLKGFDAVIHLAALSNDPIGNLNPDWTDEINFRGSVRLAELARAAGVRRFLFSSSCIMYGASEAAVVDESAPLNPRTDYARSKVDAERAISELASDRFSPVFLRNGTVYGVSPRMRFDTVTNDFMGSAITTGRVVVLGNGTPWRPVVHILDLARAFRTMLEAPLRDIHNQAFNVGADVLNCRVMDLAEIVASVVPGCAVDVLAQPGADLRTYRADFSKFGRTFPEFGFEWTPRRGVQELYDSLSAVPLSVNLFRDKRFVRLQWLTHLLESQLLDRSLRWRNHDHVEATA